MTSSVGQPGMTPVQSPVTAEVAKKPAASTDPKTVIPAQGQTLPPKVAAPQQINAAIKSQLGALATDKKSLMPLVFSAISSLFTGKPLFSLMSKMSNVAKQACLLLKGSDTAAIEHIGSDSTKNEPSLNYNDLKGANGPQAKEKAEAILKKHLADSDHSLVSLTVNFGGAKREVLIDQGSLIFKDVANGEQISGRGKDGIGNVISNFEVEQKKYDEANAATRNLLSSKAQDMPSSKEEMKRATLNNTPPSALWKTPEGKFQVSYFDGDGKFKTLVIEPAGDKVAVKLNEKDQHPLLIGKGTYALRNAKGSVGGIHRTAVQNLLDFYGGLTSDDVIKKHSGK